MDKGTWDQALDVASIVYPYWKPFVLGTSVLAGPYGMLISGTAVTSISWDQNERKKGIEAK